MLTIRERFGTLTGLRIAYVGDGRNNVATRVGEAAAMPGCRSRSPHRRRIGRRTRSSAASSSSARAQRHRARVHLPVRAVRDVDVVYTDVWTWMGEEAFIERNEAALRPYQVNGR